MGKWIRRIIVIIVVLAVVLEGVLQIYVGIERKKRAEAPGNAEKYSKAIKVVFLEFLNTILLSAT